MNSKFDRKDPGQDPDYCDGLQMAHSESPKRKKPLTEIPGYTHILVGYCENCCLSVYESDMIRTENQTKIYKCIHCKEEVNENELIPF